MAKDSTNSIGESCKIRPKNVAKIWPGKWCKIRPGKSCKFGRENGAKFGQEKIVVKESKRNRYLLWILRAVCKLGTNWLENCMNNDGEIFSIKFKPECCQNINAKPRPFKGCLDVDRKLQPFFGDASAIGELLPFVGRPRSIRSTWFAVVSTSIGRVSLSVDWDLSL